MPPLRRLGTGPLQLLVDSTGLKLGGAGDFRRSLVETAMYRYKTVIGRRLRARTLPNQQTQAKVGCNVLNRMTKLGMPISVRIK